MPLLLDKGGVKINKKYCGFNSFFKKYKYEIFFEVILLLILSILLFCKIINISFLGDATFIVAFLSLPVIAMRYITEKENDKKEEANRFYYKTLNQLLEISKEDIENNHNYSSIEIRLMQLAKIKDSGKIINQTKLSNKDNKSFEDKKQNNEFDNAIKITLVNILTADILFGSTDDNNDIFIKSKYDISKNDECTLKDKYKTLDLINRRLENYCELTYDILYDKEDYEQEKQVEKDNKNKLKAINKVLSPYIEGRFQNYIFWMREFDEDKLENILWDISKNILKNNNCIFYGCVFNDISNFENIFEYNLIRPKFKYHLQSYNESTGIGEKEVKDSFKKYIEDLKQSSGANKNIKDKNMLLSIYKSNIIEPEYYFDEHRIYLGYADVKCELKYRIESKPLFKEINMREIKKEYEEDEKYKDALFVKCSKNYNDDVSNKDLYESWFTITYQLKEKIYSEDNANKDCLFVIVNNKDRILIKMKYESLKNLLIYKDKGFEEEGSKSKDKKHNYHIYFNAERYDSDKYRFTDARSNPVILFKAERDNSI